MCLLVWLGLRSWYYYQELAVRSRADYRKVWKRWDGIWMDIAAVCGMTGAYLLGQYHGLVYIQCLRNALVLGWLLVIACVDGREQKIPRTLTNAGWIGWLLLCLTAVINGAEWKAVLLFSAGGFLLGGGVLFICRLVSKGGMGMGDVRLFAVLGVLYGMNYTFSILFFTVVLMSVFGLAAILMRKKGMKSLLPMGPFAVVSYVICIILGI